MLVLDMTLQLEFCRYICRHIYFISSSHISGTEHNFFTDMVDISLAKARGLAIHTGHVWMIIKGCSFRVGKISASSGAKAETSRLVLNLLSYRGSFQLELISCNVYTVDARYLDFGYLE